MNRWNHMVAINTVRPSTFARHCDKVQTVGYEVWVVAEDTEDGLHIEFCHEDFVDHMTYWPAWFEFEENCESDALHRLVTEDIDVADWLLQHGVAPDQPFRIRLTRHYSSSYEGDVDVAHRAEVIDVYRWDPGRAAAAWGNWLWNHYRTNREAA